MGQIMIRCPVTRRAISTGLHADRSSFARMPVFIARAHCPHCRVQHEWFARDAWVEDARGDLDDRAA